MAVAVKANAAFVATCFSKSDFVEVDTVQAVARIITKLKDARFVFMKSPLSNVLYYRCYKVESKNIERSYIYSL